MVGVNRFHAEEEKSVPIQRIDERLERNQVERLRALRAGATGDVEGRAPGSRGRGPLRRKPDAAHPRRRQKLCHRGEISDAMRKVFGEYKEAVVI